MLRVLPLGGGEASLSFSSFVCLVSIGCCCFVGFGFEGCRFEGCGFEGSLCLGLLCILSVYLGALYAF
jgi:hypothetical protein